MASPVELKVRPAKLSDAAFITDSNARMALETEGRRLDPARLAGGVNALLADANKGTYYIAEVDGKVAGQLLITREWSDWRNGNFWWIQSVYVSGEFRGAGVFRALFHHVHTLAKAETDVCGL